MNQPIAFPALMEHEVVEITAKHGNAHAFSTRVGPKFYVVCADASAPTQSRRMGIDFWGGLSAADMPSRATALSVYKNCIAIATISGSLVVGSMDRPIPAILHPGNIPRGCLSLVGEGIVASAVSGTEDKVCITTFDSHDANAVCEHEEPLFAVANSLVASEERVAVCDVSNSVSVFSLTRSRLQDGSTRHGLQLTHVLPCFLSVMSIRGNLLLARDDDAASKVRGMGLKDDHATELASIACNNADASYNRVACIEECGGDPALVVYSVSEAGEASRQPPRRLSDIQVSAGRALGFVVSLAGQKAVITSKSAPQMWVVS